MTNKAAYTLVIDKDRDDALSIMSSLIMNEGLIPRMMEWMKKDGVEAAFIDLWKEKADKQHEFGWCTADDCQHKKDIHE